MNKLENWFYNEKHTMKCYKWVHYFDIYEKHFSKFLDKKDVSILEIGVYNGGSLEMWDKFFDNATIVGVDINEDCLKLADNLGDNVSVEIGDQGSPEFWDYIKDKYGKFDIIVDDGGHLMHQQITSFECMFDHVKDNGVYLVEDTHTSYFSNFGGELKKPHTFIEYAKNFIDSMHVHHFKVKEDKTKERIDFHSKTKSISFYDSVVAIDKGVNELPESKML